jgi:hypothetical protein
MAAVSANISGRLTVLSVPSASAGTHTYTASYSGDTSYEPLSYGNVTVTTSAGGSGGLSGSPVCRRARW